MKDGNKFRDIVSIFSPVFLAKSYIEKAKIEMW